MFHAVLLCMACVAAESSAAWNAGLQSNASDLALYEQIRAKLGRGAEDHIRMALWCEAHGLGAERIKHLAMAVLIDPTHVTARGLLGLVAFRGGWQSPQAISERLKA